MSRDLRRDYRGNLQTTLVYDLEVEGSMSIDGNLEITGNLTVVDNVIFERNLTVETALEVEGALTAQTAEITGGLEVGEDVTIGGYLELLGGLRVAGSGQYTTAGGAATEVATIADHGIAAGDFVVAEINNGTNGTIYLLSAQVTANNQITFRFSANPSNNTVVNYLVLRP
jgi:cytoskeletal protein CcmA (bactofilin family)